jgi:hypothetical protein
MTLKLCPDSTHDERTKIALAAAHDLTCLGEILEALGNNDDITGALVCWLGERVGKAAAEVIEVLHGLPLPDKTPCGLTGVTQTPDRATARQSNRLCQTTTLFLNCRPGFCPGRLSFVGRPAASRSSSAIRAFLRSETFGMLGRRLVVFLSYQSFGLLPVVFVVAIGPARCYPNMVGPFPNAVLSIKPGWWVVGHGTAPGFLNVIVGGVSARIDFLLAQSSASVRPSVFRLAL